MLESNPAPIITLVEQQKKRSNRYNIYINDEYSFAVHEDVLVKHRLTKGQEIDKEQLLIILKSEEHQQAYLHAIRYIMRKARAQHEIEKRLLEKEFEQEIINEVIIKLKSQNLIDDQDFATRLTEHRIQSQKKGRKWVQQELVQKGVSKENVQHALDQIDEEEERRLAYELGKKRWIRQKGTTQEKRRKIGSFLLRRGYTNYLVNQVLRELQGEDFEEDEQYL